MRLALLFTQPLTRSPCCSIYDDDDDDDDDPSTFLAVAFFQFQFCAKKTTLKNLMIFISIWP